MGEINPSTESERRLVTVMFADISGFTAMSDNMDPEQVTCIMNDCFCMMGECIEQHGGTIDKFIGDSVMALFGAPRALENAPQNAVNTGIELRNRLDLLNQEKMLSIPLNIHIGINTGLVVAGMIGSDRKQEFTVMGDTVNIASRLEDISQVGQILVGPETYKATKTSFQYKALPPITLKGKTEPLPVYELLSVRETLFRVHTGADRMISSVMVGRDTEIGKLEFQIIKAINGEGSIVNVIGEAGIGKSRLIAELKNSPVMKRITMLEGRAISMGANLGYHLIIDLLKNWAQITEDDSEVAAFTKLESAIRTISAESLGEILPFVATFMGIKLIGRYAERVKGIEGEALEKLILKNIRDLIIKGTERTPLVIILEDLHWADNSSIELLVSLFRLAGKEKIVFINVFRPGYAKTGNRVTKNFQEDFANHYTDIFLQPLDEKQTDILITNLLNIRGFPHKQKEQIIERSGGNPYFVEEVVRSLIDEGSVVMRDHVFEVTEKLGSIIIPRTINEVLMARIDRLDQKTRDLVKTASVIGRNFFYRILAEVARTIDDMDNRLEYLEEIQLIRERKRMEELEYLFKHALAQEVAYDSILVQRRKELHKNVADSIEQVFHERLHEFYGMLAFHYSQADALEKTEEYLIKAGEESLKASASSEALHYYQQALDLYIRKYGENAEPERVAMLEKNIALALFNRAQYAEAIEYFDKVFAFYGERPGKHSISEYVKFSLCFLNFIISIYLPFLKWRGEPTQKEKDFINLYFKKGVALTSIDPRQMFIHTFYVLRHLTRYKMTKIENCVGSIATVSPVFCWPGISFTLSGKVLSFVRDKINTSDPIEVLYCSFSELTHNFLSGEWPEQIDFNYDLIEKNLSVGEFFFASSYVAWNGFLSIARGLLAEANFVIQKLTDIGETYENDHATVLKFTIHTYLLVKFRKLHEAVQEAEAGIQWTRKTSLGVWLVSLYSLKSWSQLLMKDMQGSSESIEQAEESIPKIVIPTMILGQLQLIRFSHCLCQLEKDMNSPGEVSSAVLPGDVQKHGVQALKASKKCALIRTESLKLMGVYYWMIGKQRKALKWWRKAISEGQSLNDRLELSRTYFEVGKRLLEPRSKYEELDGIKAWDYLDKARVMFEEMDLQWDQDELEKLKIQVES